jgi:fructose-bisphosphate aldolase class 1
MDMFRPQRASTPVIVRVKNVGHGIGKIRMYGVLDSNTENDKGSSNVRESVSHKLTQVSFVYTDESENFDQTQLKRVYDSTRNASAKMNGKWKSKF